MWLLTVFVKKSYLSSWDFTVMQSVHIRMNSSLSPPLKKSWIRLCVVFNISLNSLWSLAS